MSVRGQAPALFDASMIPGGRWTFYGGMLAFFGVVGYLIWKQGGYLDRRTSLRMGGPGWDTGITLGRDVRGIGPGFEWEE
jgi:hypothetical protein